MSPAGDPVVVALGGNAITPPETEGNIAEQFAQTRQTARYLVDLLQTGRRLAITHGNGPQIGNVLHRVELAANEVYPLPLHVCVADTQAGMGYMIVQCLVNEFHHRGVNAHAATMITTVEVDPDDPAFNHYTKPIGRFYPKEWAEEIMSQHDWRMVDAGKGRMRRVVASPHPKRIFEIALIRHLVEEGQLLVVCGGGGVPMVRKPNGDVTGVDCVIDKDMTSALLARELNAEALLIVTGEPRVAIDYGKPGQRWVDRMNAVEAKRWWEEGQFPAGSMGPKIEAALDFLEHATHPRARAVIADIPNMDAALTGKAGTTITA